MVRRDVNRLHRVRGISPVADDVDVRRVILHHAIDVIRLLGQPHGIHLAAHAADFAAVLPAVGVGVRPVNRGVARPFGVRRIGVGDDVAEIIVITRGGGEAKCFRVPMISVVRPWFKTEMRRRKIIPETPRGLVAKILRLNKRRAVAALGAVGAEHFRGAGQLVRAPVLPDHHAKILRRWALRAASFNVRQPTTRPPFGSNCFRKSTICRKCAVGDGIVSRLPK